MKKPGLSQWLMLAGLALALAGAYQVWRIDIGPLPAGEVPSVTEFRDDKPLAAFSLRSAKGKFGNAELSGKWSFVFFGYTQCPDICPSALSLMKEIKARLGASPAPTFDVVFISVDPKRDTQELMAQYLAAFDPSFIGITGDDAALAPLVKDLGVFYQRNESQDPVNYTVDHSAAIYLIDPKGRLAAVFSPPQDAKKMAENFLRISSR